MEVGGMAFYHSPIVEEGVTVYHRDVAYGVKLVMRRPDNCLETLQFNTARRGGDTFDLEIQEEEMLFNYLASRWVARRKS